MTDALGFAFAVLALLSTPGPTNTLLATSGAAAGFKRSFRLVGAEMLGYAISITTLALVVGPLVRASHGLGIALRIGCGVYLLYAAWRLWREGGATLTSAQPVRFRRVFVATLLNPKAIVFAYVIVPFMMDGRLREAAPYMAALLAMICVVGSVWIGIGAGVRHGSGATLSHNGFARRAGAVVLCVFGVLISGSALSA